MRKTKLFIFGLLASILYLSLALAEESENLQKLYQEISTKNTELTAVRERISSIEKESNKVVAEIRGLKQEELRLTHDLEEATLRKKEIETEINALDADLALVAESSRQRAKTLYMSGVLEQGAGVMLAANSEDPLRLAFFIKRIKELDLAKISEFDWLIKRKANQKSELDKIIELRASLQSQILAEKEILNAKMVKQKSLLSALNAEKSKGEKALTELKAQALRLETVVQSLTEESQEIDSKVTSKQAPQAKKEPELPFSGPGLFRLKGSLVVPVKGKVIRKYGKQLNTEFEDYVFNKGFEFLTDDGGEVFAVAPGRVIHVGTLPGYGLVVILDHGQRSYSLYGKLQKNVVEQGVTVEKGDVLGAASNAERNRGNFYFEVRLNGQPVDPQSYFKQKL